MAIAIHGRDHNWRQTILLLYPVAGIPIARYELTLPGLHLVRVAVLRRVSRCPAPAPLPARTATVVSVLSLVIKWHDGWTGRCGYRQTGSFEQVPVWRCTASLDLGHDAADSFQHLFLFICGDAGHGDDLANHLDTIVGVR